MKSTPRKQKEFCFFEQFEKFILASKKGRRLQPNGKRISEGTIRNYEATLRLVRLFASDTKFEMRLVSVERLNKKIFERERNYWKKFYLKFTEYLYFKRQYFDNYIGQNIKNIKVFFNYLNKESNLQAGNFYKHFYVRKENIAIFPLMPEELNFFIYNKEFEATLSPRMMEVKDVFVFGCTVALRVSDLIALKHSNLKEANGNLYLAVKSIKTNTDTVIKLPPYCVEIIKKYNSKKLKGHILPRFNTSNLNMYIKKLLEEGGLVQHVPVTRERRGRTIEVMGGERENKQYRFCDVASTHTMRRTAITTMLCLGMPEQVVRKISGHAHGSKDFFRYLKWAQSYLDKESDKVYDKLQEMGSNAI